MSDIVERWTLCGYAPGAYQCKCTSCGKAFTGDKRAIQCLPCAANSSEATITSLRAELDRKDAALQMWVDAYKTGKNEPLVIAYESTAALSAQKEEEA